MDPINEERAAWADHALQFFQMTTGCDRDDALRDLLTDLMHPAVAEGVDFANELRIAEAHFEAERKVEVDSD